MSTTTPLTDEIREQVLAVRDTGECNMFDIPSVTRIAYRLELFSLVSFLTDEKNKKAYCNFILYGDRRTEEASQ